MRTRLLAVSMLAFPLGLVSTRVVSHVNDAVATVTIEARCDGKRNTKISVSPWNVTIAQGDDVEWVLDASSNAEDFIVSPKSAAWPFALRDGLRGRKQKPAKGGRMNDRARGRYSYNIDLVCAAGGAVDTVRIDPDIIVD